MCASDSGALLRPLGRRNDRQRGLAWLAPSGAHRAAAVQEPARRSTPPGTRPRHPVQDTSRDMLPLTVPHACSRISPSRQSYAPRKVGGPLPRGPCAQSHGRVASPFLPTLAGRAEWAIARAIPSEFGGNQATDRASVHCVVHIFDRAVVSVLFQRHPTGFRRPMLTRARKRAGPMQSLCPA